MASNVKAFLFVHVYDQSAKNRKNKNAAPRLTRMRKGIIKKHLI